MYAGLPENVFVKVDKCAIEEVSAYKYLLRFLLIL